MALSLVARRLGSREILHWSAAGPEVYRKRLYQHPIFRELNMPLLSSLGFNEEHEIAGEDLDALAFELEMFRAMAHVIALKTYTDAEDIASRATEMLPVVQAARDEGGFVYLF